MKIRINENEVYEVNTSEELSTEEFFVFRDRINVIGKLMNDPFSVKSFNFSNPNIVKSFSPRMPGFTAPINSMEDYNELVRLVREHRYEELKQGFYNNLPYKEDHKAFYRKIKNDAALLKIKIQNGLFKDEKERTE